MPIIDKINCKLEKKTESYIFAFLIFSENLFMDNQSIFENLNVIQLNIIKTDV